MKKKIALLLAAVIFVLSLSLAACTGNENKNDVDMEKVKAAANDGVLVVGLDPAFPPMGFRDENGELVGFDLDLAQEVAKRLGMKYEAKAIDWDSKSLEIGSGNIDVIWNGFTMTGREDKFTWTDPYIKNSQVIVVKEDSGINSSADLAGKVLALQKGSSAEDALEKNKELKASLANVLAIADNVTAFNEVKVGGADALLLDEVVANYYISQNPGFKVIESVSEEIYGIGFALGNTELRDKVQAALEDMAKDGTLKEISEKWFGKDVTLIGK